MRVSSDCATALGLLVFVAALWFWLIPGWVGAADDRLLPEAMAVVIGVLALILLVVSLRGAGSRQLAADEDDPFLERDAHGDPAPLFLLMLVWLADAIAMRWVGFYPTSAVALVLSFIILGLRQWQGIALWTVLPLIGVYVVFEHGFSLFMPRGQLLVGWLG